MVWDEKVLINQNPVDENVMACLSQLLLLTID